MIEICVRDKCIEVGRDLFEEALKIKREMERRGDLTTRWWRRFMIALFNNVTTGGVNSISFTDTGGSSRSQDVKKSISGYAFILNTYYCNNRFWISVGNGTSPPIIDDYRLVFKLAEGLASLSYDEGQGVIVLSAGFQFSSDTTIYEVGLEWEAAVTGATCGRLLIDRTVISGGFTAPANTPITVTYRILV
jgi:hypothetical protein